MADKLTAAVLDALTKAAAAPAGTLLFSTKAEAGLFPPTTAAKAAAQRAVADGLLVVSPAARAGRETAVATEKGLAYLLDHSSPKQVLEDFVRVLESRQTEVADLLAAARRMAASLDGLRSAVAAVLPSVSATRTGQAPDRLLAELARWQAAAGEDCPLPDLYRTLAAADPTLSVGQFHDRLRALHADRRVYLHPWTGPLYALPEPAFAVLIGHNVAYYASAVPKSDRVPTPELTAGCR